MPADDNFGYSANYTPTKQVHFNKIVSQNTCVVARINAKSTHSFPYLYFDLNAGPGIYRMEEVGPEVEGSPLIALKNIIAAGLPYQAILIEQNKGLCRKLRQNIKAYGTTVQVINDDHNIVLPRYFQHNYRSFGLLYSDQKGSTPPFDLIAQFSQYYPKVDICIHIAANDAVKRQRGAGYLDCDLISLMGRIPKRKWLIRDPYEAHQWSFLFGTNWDGYKDYRSIGLYELGSKEGRRNLEILNYTPKEREQRLQPALPELSGILEPSDVQGDTDPGFEQMLRMVRKMYAKKGHRGPSSPISSVG